MHNDTTRLLGLDGLAVTSVTDGPTGPVVQLQTNGDDGNDGCDSGPSYRDLAGKGQGDSHHIIQDAAVRDLPGYSRADAPAVPLQGPATQRGTPHYLATQVQRAFGGGTYGAERNVAVRALMAAGYSAEDALAQVARADRYFVNKLGVCHDTQTRIPGNRGNQ